MASASPPSLSRGLLRLGLGLVLVAIGLEARARVGRVAYLVGAASGQRLDDIVRQLAPGSRVVPLAEDRQAVEQALSVSARRARLPLSGERLEAVARAVLAALAGTGSQEELVIQLQIGRRSRPSLWPGQQPQGWLELLGFASPPAPGSELVGQQRAQAAQHRAGVVLRLGVRASTPMRRRQLLESLLGALRLAESAGLAFRARSEAAWRLNHGQRPWRYPLTLTAHDLACVSGWPIGLGQLPAMPSRHPRFLPVPVWRDQQRVFARGVADQQDQRLGLSIRDALHHTVLLGPTGVGKSTAMLHLALADIRAGRSVLVIDPKAGLVDDLLARIPAERADDVVVIDPSDARPIGLNPVACPPGPRQAPEVVADAILAVFKQLFAESWGVRSEEILTASLLTLARTPGATLVDLPLLLTNPAIRRSIVGQHTDPLGTDQFWDTYEALSEGQRSQWIAPVLNKLQPFLIRTWLRTMLGQAEPSFDLSQLFTQRRIVLNARPSHPSPSSATPWPSPKPDWSSSRPSRRAAVSWSCCAPSLPAGAAGSALAAGRAGSSPTWSHHPGGRRPGGPLAHRGRPRHREPSPTPSHLPPLPRPPAQRHRASRARLLPAGAVALQPTQARHLAQRAHRQRSGTTQ